MYLGSWTVTGKCTINEVETELGNRGSLAGNGDVLFFVLARGYNLSEHYTLLKALILVLLCFLILIDLFV